MITADDGTVDMEGTRDEIMVDFMDIVQAIYHDILDCRNNKDNELYFNECLRFIKMTDEEQDKELLKMKNKSKLIEEVLKYLNNLNKDKE